MTHMACGHEEAMVSQSGYFIVFFRRITIDGAGTDRDELAHDIVISEHRATLFIVVVFEILGGYANLRSAVGAVVRAHDSACAYHVVGADNRTRTNTNILLDDAEGLDLDIRSEFSTRMNNGCRVYGHATFRLAGARAGLYVFWSTLV